MYDIAIIGAGVTGCAIARELSRYQAGICVIEREEDVCCGTSKANSAIIHAGFDAKPGTLKAKLNVEGNAMMDTLSKDLDIPFVRNGSLVVCTDEQDARELERLLEQGKGNGVKDLRILDREALHTMEPNLDDHVTSALYAPTGGIVCPFHMTIAFAENAVANGVEFFLNTAVTSITSLEDGYLISTDKQDITAKTVVNAAGVYADVFHNMVSSKNFTLPPGKVNTSFLINLPELMYPIRFSSYRVKWEKVSWLLLRFTAIFSLVRPQRIPITKKASIPPEKDLLLFPKKPLTALRIFRCVRSLLLLLDFVPMKIMATLSLAKQLMLPASLMPLVSNLQGFPLHQPLAS